MANVFDVFDNQPSAPPPAAKEPNVFDAFDEQPPGFWQKGLQNAGNAALYGDEGSKYVTRAAARAFGAIPDLVSSAVQGFGLPKAQHPGDYSLPALFQSGHGIPEGEMRPVWTPSEALINATGQQPGPDQTQAGKYVDAALPWAFPTGNQMARVGEAGGLFNKAMTFGRSELGNAADWFISDDMQKYAADHGWGPLAQTLMGIVGGSARHAVSATGGAIAPVIGAKKDAGTIYDQQRAVDATPAFKDIADPNASIARFVSGEGAIPFSGTGEGGAVKARDEAILARGNEGIQELAPGASRLEDAGPGTLRKYSSGFAKDMREQIQAAEQELKARTDAIEGQLPGGMNTKVDATKLREAILNIATDTGGIAEGRQAAEKLFNKVEKLVEESKDGTITYGALKGLHSTFGKEIDDLYQNSTGKKTGKRQISAQLAPIEDVIADTMGAAGDAVRPETGQAIRQAYRDWSAHGQKKRDLRPFVGELDSGGQKWAVKPGGKTGAAVLDKAVGGGDMAPLEDLGQGAGEAAKQRGVAEAIASQARPKGAQATQKFRPDIFGEGVDTRVDQEVMSEIPPEAKQKIEESAAAGRTTSEPAERGKLRQIFGGIIGALPYVAGPGAAFLGGPMAGTAAALSPLLTSVSHDPSFIRAMSGRRITADNIAGLLRQYASHAGLGASPDYVDPVKALQTGVGAGASAIQNVAGKVPDLATSILKYLNGPDARNNAGGRR